MSHMVKCVYCDKQFDRDTEPFVEINGRRYAHLKCVDAEEVKRLKEERELKELEDYIKKVLHINNISAKIKKQIRDFKQEYGYTYSGMLKTLYFWYGIHQNDPNQSGNGIGIIPFVYQDAYDFFYKVDKAKKHNATKNVKDYKPKTINIDIKRPQKENQKIKLFDLDKEL